jgi:hypothetical protein
LGGLWFKASLGKNVSKTPSQQVSRVWGHSLSIQEAQVGGSQSKAGPRQKKARPSLKNTLKTKRAGGMTCVIECLPSKHKALRSNTTTARQRERERNQKTVEEVGRGAQNK